MPTTVSSGVIEPIQARADRDGVVVWTTSFRAGQTMRINDGPFADLVGTLAHLSPKGRLRVRVHLKGQVVAVWMHSDDFEPDCNHSVLAHQFAA
jgi:transcription antitermination factor NusG